MNICENKNNENKIGRSDMAQGEEGRLWMAERQMHIPKEQPKQQYHLGEELTHFPLILVSLL